MDTAEDKLNLEIKSWSNTSHVPQAILLILMGKAISDSVYRLKNNGLANVCLSIFFFSRCFLFHTDSLVWDLRYWQCCKIWCVWNMLYRYIGFREKNKTGKKDEKEISFLRNKLYKTFCDEKIRKALKCFYKAWLVSVLFAWLLCLVCVQSVCLQCKSHCCVSLSQPQFNPENNRG